MTIQKGINLPAAKKRNINLIKKMIYQFSPISRAEIANMLSLTPATITNNVAILIADGLVRELESDNEENNVGRKPIMLEFVSNSSYIIGLEISPKGFFLSLCNVKGEVLHKKRTEVIIEAYEKTVDDVCQIINAFIDESTIPKEEISAIGLGMPGLIDHNSGHFMSSAWEVWKNHDIQKDLQDKIGLQVLVDNNVTARAVAEGLFNKDRPSTFAYLFVSRGIACPLTIQSSVLNRKITGSGELGHMSIEVNGLKCPRCGDYGCLDLYAAEVGIIEKSANAIQNGETTILYKSKEDLRQLTIEEILEAGRQGDEKILEILDSAVKYLSIGICNVIKYISPEMVIVDAYIMTFEPLKSKFLGYVDFHLSQNRWGEVQFLFKPYDAYGGAVSSAGNAINHFLLSN